MPENFKGGGGTSFRPVFEWVEKQGLRPEALVYFTDAEGEFPERAPHYPVIWLVKGREPVPWGEAWKKGSYRINFHVNPTYSLKALLDDWTAVHEFSHLTHNARYAPIITILIIVT